MDAVERTEQGRVLIGDFNAELASALARQGPPASTGTSSSHAAEIEVAQA